MKGPIFRRKIYDKFLEWKRESNGESALLVEGARRIGKSTIVEQFAKNEYKSYVIIDFSFPNPELFELFKDISDLDSFFIKLKTITHKQLCKRKSYPCILSPCFEKKEAIKTMTMTFSSILNPLAFI